MRRRDSTKPPFADARSWPGCRSRGRQAPAVPYPYLSGLAEVLSIAVGAPDRVHARPKGHALCGLRCSACPAVAAKAAFAQVTLAWMSLA